MHKFILSLVFFVTVVNCQLSLENDDNLSKPTRYVLPYTGLGLDDEDGGKDEQYYKPSRRAERIPATAYQYDEAIPEDEYYRPQPRQKIEPENYRYQPSSSHKVAENDNNYRYQQSSPSQKDYEQILKYNHLARLRVAAKKQQQNQQQNVAPQHASQPSVEQYLKEVNPTTKTSYQRPSNYLRFSGQSAGLKQEQSEETHSIKQQPIRYVLQPELQQKAYQQYEPQTPVKSVPKPPHFNLVAYQNALNAQQRLLAAENQDEPQSKSSIYVQQSIHKKPSKKQKAASRAQPQTEQQEQYEYFPQTQRQIYTPEAAPPPRYQQPLRSPFSKNAEANYQVEDPLLYNEQKELEYQTQPPIRQKVRSTRPTRKPKYQTEEPVEEDQPKYQQKEQYEDQYEEPKYQEEQPAVNYSSRRPTSRQNKVSKYSQQTEEISGDSKQPEPYLRYQSKYQPEPLSRRQQVQYHQETESRVEARQPLPSRYLRQQQYQEESQQINHYQSDLAYQSSSEIPSRYRPRGAAVSYRQDLPNSSVRYHRNLDVAANYDE